MRLVYLGKSCTTECIDTGSVTTEIRLSTKTFSVLSFGGWIDDALMEYLLHLAVKHNNTYHTKIVYCGHVPRRDCIAVELGGVGGVPEGCDAIASHERDVCHICPINRRVIHLEGIVRVGVRPVGG